MAGKMRHGKIDRVAHLLVALADREAAERDAAKTLRDDAPGGALAQRREVRALHDAKQGLAAALAEGVKAAFTPAQGKLETAFSLLQRAGKVCAFVELHGNVRAEKVGLDFDGAGGRKAMRGAVNMALEGHAIGVHPAQLGE